MKFIAFISRRDVVRQFGCLAFAFGVGAVIQMPVLAAPLDKNACAKLTKDMQNMKALDVDKLMEKGPAWAASHLSPADLSLVMQYIDLDEQMRFRCSAPGSLVHLKHIDEDDEEGGPKPQAESAENDAEKPSDQEKGGSEQSSQPKQKSAKAPKKAKPPAQASSGDAH